MKAIHLMFEETQLAAIKFIFMFCLFLMNVLVNKAIGTIISDITTVPKYYICSQIL